MKIKRTSAEKKQLQKWQQMGLVESWANTINPEYARFKAVVYWSDTERGIWFYSLEGEENGDEQKGYEDLIRRVINVIPPDLYNTITLFMNDTDDLRTTSKNYNFQIGVWQAGFLTSTAKEPLFNTAGKVILRETLQKYSGAKKELHTFSIQENPSINITAIGKIVNPVLIDYLYSRKIDIDLCRDFIREVHFKLHGKEMYALGMRNVKGGWEMRNRIMKYSNSPKTFTYINTNPFVKNVLVFEGMFNFLSAVTLWKRKPQSNVIILNSVINVDQVEWKKFDQIFFFGDNDEAGNECFSKIPNAIDKRKIYDMYNDLNDYLVGKSNEVVKYIPKPVTKKEMHEALNNPLMKMVMGNNNSRLAGEPTQISAI